MPETLSAPETDRLALSLFENASAMAGATGATWLARTDAASNVVVVKRLPSGAAKARLNETLLLSHPNVVPARRWLGVGAAAYAVRDMIRGRNISQQLAGFNGRHSAELLERLLLPVLSALEAAHGRGVVHGGVSANNVLIAEDGRVLLCDFALSDPASKTNAPNYGGAATVAGDIRAMGALIAAHLPTGGAFASDAVRTRVAGILARCDSLADLRETLDSLDKLAAVPAPQPATILPPIITPQWVGPPPLPVDDDAEGSTAPKQTPPFVGQVPPVVQKTGGAKLSWRGTEPDGVRVVSGGGGPATLILTNDGNAPLNVRMVATQRPWLQVRPMELPIRLPGGASVPLDFSISARTLSAGEYRSEIYLSASAGGASAEDLRSGWFKHTADVKVIVEANAAAAKPATEKPPYPANAPTIPAPPGCVLLLTLGAGSFSVLYFGLRLLLTHG